MKFMLMMNTFERAAGETVSVAERDYLRLQAARVREVCP